MKFLIPTQKDAFRLVNDLQLAVGVHTADRELIKTLPAGTVVAIDRMRWNKTFKMDSNVSLRILVSPDRRLGLKKYGGTNSWGTSFTLTNQQVRELDVEIVEDMK